MKRYIGIILGFMAICEIGRSQNNIDTLVIDRLAAIEKITEIYEIPHSRYILDRFVMEHKTNRMDPLVQYNKGEELSEDSRTFLGRVESGDTLIVKNVFAFNADAPWTGLVKLKEKTFLVK